MHPIFYQIGPLTIYSYGLMLALATIVCSYFLSRDAAKKGIPAHIIYDLMFAVVVGGVLGARVFYVLISWDYFSINPGEIIMLNNGGLAWQGGLLGGALAGIWFVKSRHLSLRMFLDLSAPYIALGQSIGRVGCFLNGCCYGKPLAWGIFFPVHQARLHPTQLYETLGLLLIFIILKWLSSKPHPRGALFAYYLWLAAIERFVVEFFRADHDQLWWGFSLFQYIAIGIFITGIIVFIRMRRS